MSYIQPIIYSPNDTNPKGIKPIVFDIIAPDGQTSLLSDGVNDYRMVLHANVADISLSYEKSIERQQTMGVGLKHIGLINLLLFPSLLLQVVLSIEIEVLSLLQVPYLKSVVLIKVILDEIL